MGTATFRPGGSLRSASGVTSLAGRGSQGDLNFIDMVGDAVMSKDVMRPILEGDDDLQTRIFISAVRR